MNPFLAFPLLVNAVALMSLPRQLGGVALIISAAYFTRVGVNLGPFTFTILRIVVCVGLLRVAIRSERIEGGLNRLDWWVLAWGVWLVASVWMHRDPSSQLVTRLGMVLDAWGLYFLFRVFCQSPAELATTFKWLALILAPLAAAMLFEKATAYLFSLMGGISSTPIVRAGHVRAQGPFDVSILAGNIGAVTFPLLVGIFKEYRGAALIGMAASLTMIYASTSSGPILTLGWGLVGLGCWVLRRKTGLIRWGLVVAYLVLAAVMNDPPYFIMARIDLTGSSTGWHRAELIRAAFDHLPEWWVAGTDYTRHWMPYGIDWSPDHSDITNHYLQMGVLGGIPLMLLFGGGVAKAFGLVGAALRKETSPALGFNIWTVGASLFAHALTFLSVTYYDQSIAFFYLTLAGAAAVGGTSVQRATAASAPSPFSEVAVQARRVRDRKGESRRPLTPRAARIVRKRKAALTDNSHV